MMERGHSIAIFVIKVLQLKQVYTLDSEIIIILTKAILTLPKTLIK